MLFFVVGLYVLIKVNLLEIHERIVMNSSKFQESYSSWHPIQRQNFEA